MVRDRERGAEEARQDSGRNEARGKEVGWARLGEAEGWSGSVLGGQDVVALEARGDAERSQRWDGGLRGRRSRDPGWCLR